MSEDDRSWTICSDYTDSPVTACEFRPKSTRHPLTQISFRLIADNGRWEYLIKEYFAAFRCLVYNNIVIQRNHFLYSMTQHKSIQGCRSFNTDIICRLLSLACWHRLSCKDHKKVPFILYPCTNLQENRAARQSCTWKVLPT